MRTNVTLMMFLILALSACSVGSAEPWQQLGPYGVTIAAMTGVPGYPDNLFFATEGHPTYIYRTSDAGRSWAIVETLRDAVTALAVDPIDTRTLYAAGIRGSVYRSDDDGETWQLRGTLPGDVRLRRLSVNSANRSELLAAAEAASGDSVAIDLFRSTNSGQTWTGSTAARSSDARANLLTVIPGSPPAVLVGGAAAGLARLFLTTDGGASWADRTGNIGGRCAYACAIPPDDSTALICATDAGIYYTSDQGTTWSRRTTTPTYSVEFSDRNRAAGYAGAENLVFRTSNSGWTWSAETTTFVGSLTRWLALNRSDALELYAANGRGIFHTTNGGYDWRCVTTGLRLLTIPWFCFAPPARETIYSCPPGYGLIRSTDQGRNWTDHARYPGSALTVDIAVNVRHPDTVVTVTGLDSDLRLTFNRGDSWRVFPIANRFSPQGIMYHASEQDTLYVFGSQRFADAAPSRFAIYKSADGGQNWSLLHARGGSGACRGMMFHRIVDTVYAWGEVDGTPRVIRSVNRGAAWSDMSAGLTGTGPVRHLVPSPASPRVMFAAAAAGVFRTSDAGQSWENIGLENVSSVLPDTVSTVAVWAGTDTQGVWYTTNRGFTWNADTLGMPSRAVALLARHPNSRTISYCGTFGSSLLGHGGIGIEESPATRPPAEVRVSPSVLRPGAVLRLELARVSGPATIDVCAVTGHRVRRIARLASCPAELCWRVPSPFAAGVYLITVGTTRGRQTDRLVITH